MKILGISGLARSGKDSFYELCKPFLDKEGVKHRRMAFADELKEEADLILSKYVGISAFTENAEEKKVIRPLLVTYGTHIRRKINPLNICLFIISIKKGPTKNQKILLMHEVGIYLN